MRHNVVMFSGGAGSWAAAQRVVERHGTATLLFADTLIEDDDLYRFLDDAAADVGGKLVKIAEGRTPWEVFRDVRFLGNSRIDPCSRVLKREACDAWLVEHCDPAETTIYVGIGWEESHRFEAIKRRFGERGWSVEAPMCEPPYLTAAQVLNAMRARGLAPPRLYAMGFPHNNCGGFCVKAGQAHFETLLRQLPDRYAYHEAQEESLRAHLGKDVSILRDRRDGETTPLSLRTFRERIERQPGLFDRFEWGGCGCFAGEAETTIEGEVSDG